MIRSSSCPPWRPEPTSDPTEDRRSYTTPGDVTLAVEQGLQAARVQVLCLSPQALKSDWVMLERSTVLFRDPTNRGRRFIPLLLTDCDMPDTLRRYKYVDYREESDAAYGELLAACRVAEAPEDVTAKPAPPKERETRRRGRRELKVEGSVLERKLGKKKLRNFVSCIAVATDGSWAAGGNDRGIVAIWDLVSHSLRREMRGHRAFVSETCIDDKKRFLVSTSEEIIVWDVASGQEVRRFGRSISKTRALALAESGDTLLSGGDDGALRLWNLTNGKRSKLIRSGPEDGDRIFSIAFGRNEDEALTGHYDGSVRLWNLAEGRCVGSMFGHQSIAYRVRMLSDGRHAVSSSGDCTLKIWDLVNETCVATLEGHESDVHDVAISPNGRHLASTGFNDHTIRIWDRRTGVCQEVISVDLETQNSTPLSVAFTPNGSRLLAGTAEGLIFVYQLATFTTAPPEQDRRYVNAKVVLVGPSGVGKSALAHRLVEDKSVKTQSTHGMNIWRLDLPLPPASDLEREVLLWDLAGQSDYKLIHQLYLQDTTLALLLIDPQSDDPFAEASEWVKSLRMAARVAGANSEIPKLLIPARIDVGGLSVSRAKIDSFCEENGVLDTLPTSAVRGDNCSDELAGGQASPLKQLISGSIDWDLLPWTTTPRLLAALKNAVMAISDTSDIRLLRFAELAQRLEAALPDENFGESDVRTAVRLLANHGVIRPLKFGDLLLLKPELLNGYASAIIRAARAHQDEIGCVFEDDVYSDDFDFTGVDRLPRADEELLLRALVQTLLDHALCIRERTSGPALLIFPSQYRRERTISSHPNVHVSYTFCGELQTIYTTLVVRLWHGAPFDHKELWRNAAEFTTAKGHTVGILFESLGDGRGRISAFFDGDVPDEIKVVFLGFVHHHLQRLGQDVERERHYVCCCGRAVTDLEAVRQRIAAKKTFITCQICDGEVPFHDPIEARMGSDASQRKIAEVERRARAELDNQAREQILVGHMMSICGEANQIFREIQRPDYGIDGEVEFRADTGEASGRKVYVQLKSGPSHLRLRKSDGKEIYDISDRHRQYWLDQPVDVFLVIRDKDEVIRWMNITRYLRESGNATRQIIFEAEKLDFEAVWRLRDTVMKRRTA